MTASVFAVAPTHSVVIGGLEPPTHSVTAQRGNWRVEVTRRVGKTPFRVLPTRLPAHRVGTAFGLCPPYLTGAKSK